MQQQNELRARGKRARADLSAEERAFASEVIASKVVSAHWFWRSELVGCYLGTGAEVETWDILARAWQMKKRIFVPVLQKKSRMSFREMTGDSALRRNRFGILEPADGEIVAARRLDIVITPVAAFDGANARVGMGGGYFDRTFGFQKRRRHLVRPKLIGLAFKCQQTEQIPANPWDVRLFTVVSEH